MFEEDILFYPDTYGKSPENDPLTVSYQFEDGQVMMELKLEEMLIDEAQGHIDDWIDDGERMTYLKARLTKIMNKIDEALAVDHSGNSK